MKPELQVIDGGKVPKNDLDFIQRRAAQISAEVHEHPEFWEDHYAKLDAANARIKASQTVRSSAKPRRSKNAVSESDV